MTVASGVCTAPSARCAVQGSAAAGEPSGWAMVMERIRVGMRSAVSSPKSLFANPITCSMPSSRRMKQSSHLRSSPHAHVICISSLLSFDRGHQDRTSMLMLCAVGSLRLIGLL